MKITINKKEILCFSGGKDSSVILHKLLESGWRGEIVHGDTTLELPEHYEWLKWFEDKYNIKIKIVKSNIPIDEWLHGKFEKGQKKGEVRGLPLGFGVGCHIRGRFKVNPIQKYINTLKKQGEKKILLGFGLNELERSKQKTYTDGNFGFPLIDWKMTEKDCLDYIRKHNLPFPFLHKDRTGCYLCPQQSQHSLWQLWRGYPKLWDKTKYYESFSIYGYKGARVDLLKLENKFKNGFVPERKINSCFSCQSALCSLENMDFKEKEKLMDFDGLNEKFDFTKEELEWCYLNGIYKHEDKVFFIRARRKNNFI